MADGKYLGSIPSEPIEAGCVRNLPRRVSQPEDEANGPPSGVTHPDHDRRPQKGNERQQVLLGASVHPARQNGRIHRPFFDAQDGVGQKDRGAEIAPRRVPYCNAGCSQQLIEIFIRLVDRLVAPPTADEIADIAEILADDEQFWAAMAKPLLPVTDYIRVEVEFGAAPNFSGAALDTDAAALARRDQRLKLKHMRPMPGLARPNDEVDDPQNRAARGVAVYSRNNRGTYRGGRRQRGPCAPPRRVAPYRHNPG